MAVFIDSLGVVRLDQSRQRWPWHNRFDLREKLLPLGLLLGCGQLENRGAELLVTHQSSSDLRLQYQWSGLTEFA